MPMMLVNVLSLQNRVATDGHWKKYMKKSLF